MRYGVEIETYMEGFSQKDDKKTLYEKTEVLIRELAGALMEKGATDGVIRGILTTSKIENYLVYKGYDRAVFINQALVLPLVFAEHKMSIADYIPTIDAEANRGEFTVQVINMFNNFYQALETKIRPDEFRLFLSISVLNNYLFFTIGRNLTIAAKFYMYFKLELGIDILELLDPRREAETVAGAAERIKAVLMQEKLPLSMGKAELIEKYIGKDDPCDHLARWTKAWGMEPQLEWATFSVIP